MKEYIKITLRKTLEIKPYIDEFAHFELEDVAYNPDGSKYVICERDNYEDGKRRLLYPLISSLELQIDQASKSLNFLRSL